MATVPAPPPPPPPPPCGNQLGGISSPPRPEFAAIPFFENPPVPETSPSPEALQVDAPATPPHPVENELQFLPSDGQENDPSDSEEKHGPVQETDPPPQTRIDQQIAEHQNEAAMQMDQTGEDPLP